MHIVFVSREYIGSSRAGGIASYIAEMAKIYHRLGHKVTVITASEDTRIQSTENINGVNIIRLDGGDFINPDAEKLTFLKRFRGIYRFKSYRKNVKKAIENLKDVDIIEAADYGAESLYLNKLNIPVVLRLHTPMSLSIETLKRYKCNLLDIFRSWGVINEEKVYRNSKYLSSCSNALLDWVKENINISPRLMTAIKNPIDSSTITEVEVPRERNTIFYAGTICETKGVGDLIEACQIVRSKGHDISLILAGKGGAYCGYLNDKIINNNWGWCKIIGKVPREEIFKLYASTHVSCFPSWWDNMPMVCIEAMAYKSIVIASTSGGAKEFIKDGENGFLVERKNPQQLADTIIKAITLSEDEEKSIRDCAKNTILNNLSSEIIANQMLVFFDVVIKDFQKVN